MSKERYFANPIEDYCCESHGTSERELIPKTIILDLINRYVDMILKHVDQEKRPDLYVGVAGVAFMFWKLSRSKETKHLFPCLEHASTLISHAKKLLTESKHSTKNSVAFLCGNAGISAVSAVLSHDLGMVEVMQIDLERFLEGQSLCTTTSGFDIDEVLVGRAGYLHGAYWLNQTISPKTVKVDILENICTSLLKRGRRYARSRKTISPLMYEYHGKEYLGAAHGISAILHALLESPWFRDDKHGKFCLSSSKLSDIKESIDYLVALQSNDGDIPTRHDSDRMLVHWCHGCSGVVYLFAKAYLTFKEAKYLHSARKCTEAIWHRGLLRKGPGICHGVAGNGYAFLLLYRLTGENMYLYRAGKFAEFLNTDIFQGSVLKPDRPYSLYEGLAGCVCYLTDLLNPSVASYPFMDVFETKFDVS